MATPSVRILPAAVRGCTAFQADQVFQAVSRLESALGLLPLQAAVKPQACITLAQVVTPAREVLEYHMVVAFMAAGEGITGESTLYGNACTADWVSEISL